MDNNAGIRRVSGLGLNLGARATTVTSAESAGTGGIGGSVSQKQGRHRVDQFNYFEKHGKKNIRDFLEKNGFFIYKNKLNKGMFYE